MAHISEQKKNAVAEFTKLIEEYPIIGIVNMQNLPTKQLQNMRENLRGKVLLRMTKKRLLKIVFNDSKKSGIQELNNYLKGMPALLLTNDNPFALFSTLKKNKSNAPISGEQIAPKNIVVSAGKTNFAPGPVIGELGSFGIKTGVEGGKIAIKADKIVAKEGEVVSAKLAGLLLRLGIEPMEIGLDLVAVYENGEILTKDVLDIDESAYFNNFKAAATMAFNLAFNSGYPTEETIKLLIQKAAADSKTLAIKADILTDETVGIVLAKAERQATGLKSKLNLPKVSSEPVKVENNEEQDAKKEETQTTNPDDNTKIDSSES